MKKILLSLAMLLTGVGAWAQDYSLTEFEVTTDESQPKTYVMESRRPAYLHPDWFLDGENVKMQQSYTYAAAEKEEKNKFLFYFTQGSNGGYYIHPYNAEDGHVLGVASAAANAKVVVVDKANPGTNIAIEWTLGELTNTDNVTRKYFKATIGETEYCLQDNGSGNHVIIGTTPSFVSTALNFGKCDPYIATAQDALTDAINAFEYKIAYQCLGDEEGQFVDDGDAYKTAYDEAQDAITAGTGEFETLLENLETAFEDLEYTPLTTGKYYTIQSKSNKKYLAPNTGGGKPMLMSESASIFELTTDTWLEMYNFGVWINGVNHGNGGQWHNTNKFYRVADGSCIIAATSTGSSNHHILKAGDSNLTSVADNAIDEACYWIIEEFTQSMAISATDKYATFYAPVAVSIPNNVSAYYVSATSTNSATLTELETTIPANTGVVLYSEAGYESAPCEIVDYVAPQEGNLLSGSIEAEQVTGPAYILAKVDDTVGFYAATLTDGKFQNNAGKAYLLKSNVPSAAGARFLTFDFGTETAIESVEGAENANAVVYDLAGRRVQGVQKGLYIVNGKKVIK